MTFSCIIVEDEPIALKKLTGFVEQVPLLNLVGSFDNSIDALNFLNTNRIDLLLLDIHMDKLNGIQLLETLPNKPNVILITAYSEYAVKGFELNVIDYLLKPYSFERFMQAIGKAMQIIPGQQETSNSLSVSDSVFIKTSFQIEKLKLSEILYVEGMKDYLGIITPEKRVMCLQSFKSLLNILPTDKFFRVHKSFVVNLDKIESISNHRIKINEKYIPIGNTYQVDFYNALKTTRGLI